LAIIPQLLLPLQTYLNKYSYTIYPFVVGVIFQWSIAVGLSYVIGIPLGYGLVGMWVGFALDENIRGVILLRRWRSGKWRSKGFVSERK
jgi:Na+-driven multidrug efflux pump